jgi:ribonuclease P protein component
MRLFSIKNQREFDRVFDKGKRYNGALLTGIIAKSTGQSKLGIIVNSKFGNAVIRNRVKRQIREAFSSIADRFLEKSETVVIPRASAKKATTPEILMDISSIAHRAGIL